MRLVSLKLRGAIGISKGLGLEEIEIDFSRFNSGLIVMVGENGRGKTTIIENLHPYRRLVSRDGNLADHFFLKDSYRKLEFIYNGNNYTSEIYIDGSTKKVEAYLRQNEFSLNDGKATTYDEIVEKMFGSPDLFFNSVFSAQKSMGLSELSSGQKRDLFYELLNLTRYEKFQEKAKSYLRETELSRERVEQKIESCKSEINLLTKKELELEEEKKKSSLLTIKLKQVEESLADSKSHRSLLEKKMNDLLDAKRSNELILKKISQYEKELELTSNEYKLIIDELTKEMDSMLVKLNNENSPLELIKQEKKSLEEERAKLENNCNSYLIEKEIDALNIEIKTITNKIVLLKNMEFREEEIKSVIDKKSNLSLLIDKCNREEVGLTTDRLNLEQNKKRELDELTPEYEKLLKAKEKLSRCTSSIAIETAKKERLSEEFQTRTNQIEEDVTIIKDVPCTHEVGQKCSFLSRAYKSQNELEFVKMDFESRIQEQTKFLESLIVQSYQLEQSIKNLIAHISTTEQNIDSKYSREFGAITAQLDKLKIIRSSSEIELKNISETFPESSLEEIENSKRETVLLKQKIEHYKLLIESKKSLVEETKQREASQLLSIIEKINFLDFRLTEVGNQIKREKENMLAMFEHKKRSQEENFKTKSLQLESIINQERKVLKEFVEDNIIVTNKELEACIGNCTANQIEKDRVFRELVETETKIELIKSDVSNLNQRKEELTNYSLHLDQLQNDIKEYSLLVKAFDKTGIPILKLENSSVMITSIANELLASFDNKFRISFETTKLTKDKKKMKEVFEINVLDEEGLCELKNKSGGERVWIETSIQLALGILLRSQGKVHQTSFLDEQDGALDAGNALCYRAMIEKAHEKSGVYNTIIITHRNELVELIDQKLVFSDSKIKSVA